MTAVRRLYNKLGCNGEETKKEVEETKLITQARKLGPQETNVTQGKVESNRESCQAKHAETAFSVSVARTHYRFHPFRALLQYYIRRSFYGSGRCF